MLVDAPGRGLDAYLDGYRRLLRGAGRDRLVVEVLDGVSDADVALLR